MADKPKTETRTIQVGDEAVPFEAIIGRNVPLRVEEDES